MKRNCSSSNFMSKQTEITGGKKSFFSFFYKKKCCTQDSSIYYIYSNIFLDCVCVLFFSSSISSDGLGNRNRILVYTRKISRRKMDLSQVENFLQLVLKSFLQGGTSETRSVTKYSEVGCNISFFSAGRRKCFKKPLIFAIEEIVQPPLITLVIELFFHFSLLSTYALFFSIRLLY